MSYNSPINIIEQHLADEIKEIDNQIFLKAQSLLDVDIDKDELIKALKYDRDQYNKGYDDGFKNGYNAAIKDMQRKLLNISNNDMEDVSDEY